ncbi:MAG: MurR/RpiR family transcriptional regulator [Sphaerobacter sp.]|nr:MurR/RpiR family transcriptional regulator [Sphaerobacter sp.]
MAPSELQQRIAARYDRLSPKQRQVARFIADNEAFTAFASAAELGKAVDVDAATVVRLAQSLGFSGYAELQEVIRGQIPERLTFVERVEQQRQQPRDRQQLPVRVFTNDIDNLNQTLSQTQPEVVHAAVEAICRADHVVAIGMGFSAAVAVFLGHGLNSLGVRTTVCTEGGSGLTIMLANLRPTDLVIGVSVWRYLRETVDALKLAAERGVPTLALTDSSVSPPARIADHVLVAATRGVGHSLSPVGLMAIVNLLLAEIVARDPERTLPTLREIDRLYRERGMVDGAEQSE